MVFNEDLRMIYPYLPSGNLICYSLILKMAIDIVDLPVKNGDFP
jgi:hypothetical protein